MQMIDKNSPRFKYKVLGGMGNRYGPMSLDLALCGQKYQSDYHLPKIFFDKLKE